MKKRGATTIGIQLCFTRLTKGVQHAHAAEEKYKEQTLHIAIFAFSY
jgi:hypothetical protein